MGATKSSLLENDISAQAISTALIDFAHKGAIADTKEQLESKGLSEPHKHSFDDFVHEYFSDTESEIDPIPATFEDSDAYKILQRKTMATSPMSPRDDSLVLLSLSPRSEAEFDPFPVTPRSPTDCGHDESDVSTPCCVRDENSQNVDLNLNLSPKGARLSRRGGICACTLSQVPETIRSLRSLKYEMGGECLPGATPQSAPLPEWRVKRRATFHEPSTRTKPSGQYGLCQNERSLSYFESISSEMLSPPSCQDYKSDPSLVKPWNRKESFRELRRKSEFGGNKFPLL